MTNIYTESKNIWIEGNALLEADTTYLYNEKVKIKTAILSTINKKYSDMTPLTAPPAIEITPEILAQISGSVATLTDIKTILPKTGNYLEQYFDINPDIPLVDNLLSNISISARPTVTILDFDASKYFEELKANGKEFKLIV
jgi:hypothetical protein